MISFLHVTQWRYLSLCIWIIVYLFSESYTYICMWVYAWIFIHIFMYVCIIMHVCMCLFICVYDFMGIYVHAWVFVALNMCVHCALQSLQINDVGWNDMTIETSKATHGEDDGIISMVTVWIKTLYQCDLNLINIWLKTLPPAKCGWVDGTLFYWNKKNEFPCTFLIYHLLINIL